MKNFDFHRFVSLVKYDYAENGKAYTVNLGLAVLVYIFITGFWCYAHTLSGSQEAEITVTALSLAALLLSCVVFSLFATSHLVVNRYCESRTATAFNMLPATHIEKGCLVLLQLFVVSVVLPLLYYIVIYTGSWLSMLIAGYSFDYDLNLNFWSVFEEIWSHGVLWSNSTDIAKRCMATLLVAFVPVFLAVNFMVYQIIVTFFRNTRVQLWALFTHFLLHNALGFIVVPCCTLFAVYAVESEKFDPIVLCYIVDAAVIIHLPVLAALVWWFFRRLHYKEIR